MKKINFWLLVLISTIAISSCKSSRLDSGLRSDYFLLTPLETKEFVEKSGFTVKKVQLTIYENRPMWFVEAEEDNILMEIYGFSFFVPQDCTRLIIPSTDDIIMYHGEVLHIRDNHGLYLERED